MKNYIKIIKKLMFSRIKQSIKKNSIFEDIIEDNSNIENREIILEEENIQDMSLFKIPKYLETVNFFNFSTF
jgi:hypothetical protein